MIIIYSTIEMDNVTMAEQETSLMLSNIKINGKSVFKEVKSIVLDSFPAENNEWPDDLVFNLKSTCLLSEDVSLDFDEIKTQCLGSDLNIEKIEYFF